MYLDDSELIITLLVCLRRTGADIFDEKDNNVPLNPAYPEHKPE